MLEKRKVGRPKKTKEQNDLDALHREQRKKAGRPKLTEEEKQAKKNAIEARRAQENGDTIISAPELISWQNDALKWLCEHETGGVLVVKACRQVGKSFTIGLLALKASLENNNSDSYIVSPTLAQSRNIYKNLTNMLANMPIVKTFNNSLYIIELINGSTINFKSAQQKDALRGYTCRGKGILIFDEAAFLEDDIFGLCLPYTNVNNNSIIYTSTPLFKDGQFYKMWTSDLGNVSQIDVMKYDLSYFINDDQKRIYKETLSSQQYLSEIEGQFLVEFSSVFGEFKKCINNNVNLLDREFYIGIDWGTNTQNDYTAIIVMNKSKQVVKIVYFNDKSVEETIATIQQICAEYRPKKVTVEKNSIGNVFGDLLKKRIPYPFYYFTTTNDSKNRIINSLQVAIQNETIQLLDNAELKIQLACYEVEQTKSGKITYNAKQGQHDDLVMALAICHDSINKGHFALSTIN